MGEEVRGLRSTNRYLQNSHGDVKYSTRNEVPKNTLCMIHQHAQWCGDCLRGWVMLSGRGQRGKNWDNCNSIIKSNTIFKKVLERLSPLTMLIN